MYTHFSTKSRNWTWRNHLLVKLNGGKYSSLQESSKVGAKEESHVVQWLQITLLQDNGLYKEILIDIDYSLQYKREGQSYRDGLVCGI